MKFSWHMVSPTFFCHRNLPEFPLIGVLTLLSRAPKSHPLRDLTGDTAVLGLVCVCLKVSLKKAVLGQDSRLRPLLPF